MFLLIPIVSSAILKDAIQNVHIKLKTFYTAFILTTDIKWWICSADDSFTEQINVPFDFSVLLSGITISLIATDKHALIAYEIAMAQNPISPVMTRFDNEPRNIRKSYFEWIHNFFQWIVEQCLRQNMKLSFKIEIFLHHVMRTLSRLPIIKHWRNFLITYILCYSCSWNKPHGFVFDKAILLCKQVNFILNYISSVLISATVSFVQHIDSSITRELWLPRCARHEYKDKTFAHLSIVGVCIE